MRNMVIHILIILKMLKKAAQEDSKNGYAVHINKTNDGGINSEIGMIMDKTEFSYENGYSLNEESIGDNYYKELDPKAAIDKATIDFQHANKTDNDGLANKIAGNLKNIFRL